MNIKKDFPILRNNIVYLDSASTTQKPQEIIDAIKEFYEKSNSNIHRGLYKLSEKATQLYESTREKVAKFINSNSEEIIFTRGTTESLNLIANCIGNIMKEGETILLTEMEHHSNLVPWQVIAKKNKFKLRFIPVDKNGDLMIDEKLFKNVKVVSVTHVSNALGTINDIKKIEELAHKNNAYFILDAAQSVGHFKLDVKKINCDFLAFSGHKMIGPFGIGVLYGKKELLEKIEPFLYGGDMIKEVNLNESKWNDIPWKFEAGTQNIEGVIGLGKAIDYIDKLGFDEIQKHEKEITEYALNELSKIKELKIYSPKERAGIISFNVKGIHSHDVAQLLDNYNICVRAGHHCCMPLMKKLEVNGTVRVSLYIYNAKEDIDNLVESLRLIIKEFKK